MFCMKEVCRYFYLALDITCFIVSRRTSWKFFSFSNKCINSSTISNLKLFSISSPSEIIQIIKLTWKCKKFKQRQKYTSAVTKISKFLSLLFFKSKPYLFFRTIFVPSTHPVPKFRTSPKSTN